jgi:hypothetical protein
MATIPKEIMTRLRLVDEGSKNIPQSALHTTNTVIKKKSPRGYHGMGKDSEESKKVSASRRAVRKS